MRSLQVSSCILFTTRSTLSVKTAVHHSCPFFHYLYHVPYEQRQRRHLSAYYFPHTHYPNLSCSRRLLTFDRLLACFTIPFPNRTDLDRKPLIVNGTRSDMLSEVRSATTQDTADLCSSWSPYRAAASDCGQKYLRPFPKCSETSNSSAAACNPRLHRWRFLPLSPLEGDAPPTWFCTLDLRIAQPLQIIVPHPLCRSPLCTCDSLRPPDHSIPHITPDGNTKLNK